MKIPSVCIHGIWIVILSGFFLPCHAQSSLTYHIKNWSLSNGGGAVASTSFYIEESGCGGFAVGNSSSSSFSLNGGLLITAIGGSGKGAGKPVIPESYRLSQNYPNPFNPITTFEYDLPKAGDIQIQIYNNLGKVVRTFDLGYQAAGKYRIHWDGKDDNGKPLASGHYFYRMHCPEFSSVRRMLLLK